MKDSVLVFDRSCHVIYSKPCKAQILEKIARHYPESEREVVWENVQKKYARFLSDWRTDLGGKKNFHNGARGFSDGFVQMYLMLLICNLIDRFFIDELWVCRTKCWIIPGTEDLMPYITARDKVKKWISGIVGMAVIAAILSAVMLIFVR